MPEDHEWAEFLDRLIHDVREPLRSIHAFSELLRETAANRLGADGEEALGQILSGTSRIRTLVDGISGYALALRENGETSGSGKVSMQLAFNLALDALNSQILASHATVTAEALPRVDMPLERLIQLFENLIGNSLKFRSEAPPEVRILARSENDGSTVQVEDNGIGIDAVECERVFAPFARIHGRKYPGVGLGLTICRKIVEAHGGEIRLSPGSAGGAICTFWLPAV
jgi:chemotaxis family two-component system sensor kinase Cph1